MGRVVVLLREGDGCNSISDVNVVEGRSEWHQNQLALVLLEKVLAGSIAARFVFDVVLAGILPDKLNVLLHRFII